LIQKFWQNNKGILLGLFLLLFFRSAIADWYHVPSSSMEPNVLIGDRVWVNKLAYDVKVPFSDINLNRHAEPEVGDVIVFQSKAANNRLIKRVIGLPGDKIAMQDNRLLVNGQPVPIERLDEQQWFDDFLKDRDQAVYFKENHSLDADADGHQAFPIRISRFLHGVPSSFYEIEVPADHYWVMGDNRDNSADSRVIGLVPRVELVGRAERIVVSLDVHNYYLPRRGRYWETL